MADFNDDFATAWEWARMYRDLGLSVVPAHTPHAGQWKRPWGDWLEFQNALVPEGVFVRWYDPVTGEHRNRRNMGLICGAASGGLVVVDLDVGEHKDGRLWWNGLVAVEANGLEPETACQITGGGGRQLLFRAPDGWTPPTFKASPVGVDIRGQGGFIMAPPSMHASGQIYDWEPGRGPWEQEIAEAPAWLCAAIDRLRLEHGGTSTGPREHVASEHAKGPFGHDIDDREHKLQAMVWAAVVDLYRESPIPPPQSVQEAEIERIWTQYEATTRTRLERLPGVSNAELLEREGRGISELRKKWAYAMARWDTKVAEAARLPKPDPDPVQVGPWSWDVMPGEVHHLPDASDTRPDALDEYELLSIDDLDNLPDVEWIVRNVLARASLGLLFGAPGSWKTFVALDLALTLAYDVASWLEQPANTGASVLYIASEGATGLGRRIKAWRRKHGHEKASDRFHLIRAPLSFMNANDVAKLVRTLDTYTAKHGAPALIVVDTVSRVLPGADENLQKDMTIFVQACDALRLRYGAAVLGVHHTNKAGDMRGSSVLLGAADAVFRAEVVEGSSGVLVCEKQKEAEGGWRRTFMAELEEWFVPGQVECVKSLVIDWTQDETASRWPPRDTLRRMQMMIQAAFEAGQPLSMTPQTRKAGRYAPVRLSKQFDVAADVVSEVVQAWLDNGVVANRRASSNTKMYGLEVVEWLP